MLRWSLPQIYIQLKNVDIGVDMQLLKMVRGWREFREKRGLKRNEDMNPTLLQNGNLNRPTLLRNEDMNIPPILLRNGNINSYTLFIPVLAIPYLFFKMFQLLNGFSFSNRVQYINLKKTFFAPHVGISNM